MFSGHTVKLYSAPLGILLNFRVTSGVCLSEKVASCSGSTLCLKGDGGDRSRNGNSWTFSSQFKLWARLHSPDRSAIGRTGVGVGRGWDAEGGRQVDWLAGSVKLINRILCARSRHAGKAAVPVRVWMGRKWRVSEDTAGRRVFPPPVPSLPPLTPPSLRPSSGLYSLTPDHWAWRTTDEQGIAFSLAFCVLLFSESVC